MTAPSQVIGLAAGTVSYNQVPLSWTAQSGAIRYNVKRSTVAGGPYTTIAPPPVLTTNTYTDIAASPSNTYYYVVSASSVAGEGSNSAEIVVSTPAAAPDFSLSPTPTSLTLDQSGSATSTITVSALRGYSGTVGLSASSSPGGPIADFNPRTIAMSGNSIMTVTANGVPAGTYSLTITGADSASGLVHTALITVKVTPGGSFAITANPPNLTVSRSSNSAVSTTLTVASANGFAGSVGLSLGSLPKGVSAQISPNSVSVSPTNSTTAILKLTAARKSSVGTFSISVIGASSGVSSRTIVITLQIVSLP